MTDPVPSEPSSSPLTEVAGVFLRLGLTAFGGPAAHIALMEAEFVRRRQWLTRERFLDLLGACNLIPGPNSTEMAIHLGHLRAGWAGLLVAGVCFILPAMLLVFGIAWLYVEVGGIPEGARYLQAFLYGVKPVVIAVIAQALFGLTRAALKTRFLAVLAVAVAVLSFLSGDELALLFGAGALTVSWHLARSPARPAAPSLWFLGSAPLAVVNAAVVPVTLTALFLVFLKIGSVLFGSGYVLLAFLRAEMVENRRWLTEGQLLDAVAVGQVTPGPVFTTATFIGYVVAGPAGAVVATVGIFLPAFVFVALSGWLVPRLRKSPVAGAFLDGVNAAALALMAVVAVQLGRAALIDATTILLGLASALLLLRWKVNSAWLVLAGGAIGLFLAACGWTPLPV